MGVADFGGDGKQDVAAVITPHVGGVLTLHHYRLPQLVPYARTMDFSNYLVGSPEQQLAVIVQLSGQRPTIIAPNMSLKALHSLLGRQQRVWQVQGAGGRDATTGSRATHRPATRDARYSLRFAG